jgi:hypothetical protein
MSALALSLVRIPPSRLVASLVGLFAVYSLVDQVRELTGKSDAMLDALAALLTSDREARPRVKELLREPVNYATLVFLAFGTSFAATGSVASTLVAVQIAAMLVRYGALADPLALNRGGYLFGSKPK